MPLRVWPALPSITCFGRGRVTTTTSSTSDGQFGFDGSSRLLFSFPAPRTVLRGIFPLSGPPLPCPCGSRSRRLHWLAAVGVALHVVVGGHHPLYAPRVRPSTPDSCGGTWTWIGGRSLSVLSRQMRLVTDRHGPVPFPILPRIYTDWECCTERLYIDEATGYIQIGNLGKGLGFRFLETSTRRTL